MYAHGTCAHNCICVPSAHAHTIGYACPLRMCIQLHTSATPARCARPHNYTGVPTAHALHTQLQRCVKLHMRIRLHLMLKVHACPTAFAHGLFAAHVFSCERVHHEVLTYIEYRAVSGVFRTIHHPPPLHPASVSSSRVVRGWGVNISEDARHWIGLLQHNPSTGCTNHAICTVRIMCLWRMKRLYNKNILHKFSSCVQYVSRRFDLY
jgi:hypothetical protein